MEWGHFVIQDEKSMSGLSVCGYEVVSIETMF